MISAPTKASEAPSINTFNGRASPMACVSLLRLMAEIRPKSGCDKRKTCCLHQGL